MEKNIFFNAKKIHLKTLQFFFVFLLQFFFSKYKIFLIEFTPLLFCTFFRIFYIETMRPEKIGNIVSFLIYPTSTRTSSGELGSDEDFRTKTKYVIPFSGNKRRPVPTGYCTDRYFSR